MIIYITTNLINGKKYIGKDERNSPTYLGSGKLLRSAISFYGKKNFIKEILCYGKDKTDLNDLEEYYINYYNAQKSDLFYNLAPGGTGGKVLEDYSYQSTPVYQFNLDGSLLKKWSSIKDACNLLGCDSQNITRSCKNGMQTSGFRWSYAEIPLSNRIFLKSKKIYQLNLNGEIIKEWNYLTEIRDILGYNPGQISGVLRGKRKTAKGYKWIYKTEYKNVYKQRFCLPNKEYVQIIIV